jgi:hypothetical protein
MSRWLRTSALMLLPLVCAVAAVRYDLSRWELARAYRAFRNNDLRGAVTSWSSVANSPQSRHLALLNRGVARYRLGELVAASADFRTATAAGDPTVRQPALYNLGTTLLVMEQKQTATDREKSERILTEAVRQLQAAVDLNPTDSDAGHNKALADARLTALASGRPGAAPTQKPHDMARQGTAASRQPGPAGTKTGKAGAATDLDTPAGQKRAAPALTPEQALRMLDDARGREALRSAVTVRSRHDRLTPPEKDW